MRQKKHVLEGYYAAKIRSKKAKKSKGRAARAKKKHVLEAVLCGENKVKKKQKKVRGALRAPKKKRLLEGVLCGENKVKKKINEFEILPLGGVIFRQKLKFCHT